MQAISHFTPPPPPARQRLCLLGLSALLAALCALGLIAPAQAQKPAAPQNLEVIEQGIYGYTVAAATPRNSSAARSSPGTHPRLRRAVTKYKIKVWQGNQSGNLIVWTQYRAWKDVAIFTYDPMNDYAHGEWETTAASPSTRTTRT